MKVAVIVAVAENGVIGRGGDLPWRLSADLQRFKQLTMNHPIIMGRRTWESIGRPLPGRTSIVVTRSRDFDPGFKDVRAAGSLDEALALAAETEGASGRCFVIGGAQLYEAALPVADELYLTRVRAKVDGDVTFPAIDVRKWRLLRSEPRAADQRNEHPVEFEHYERTGK